MEHRLSKQLVRKRPGLPGQGATRRAEGRLCARAADEHEAVSVGGTTTGQVRPAAAGCCLLRADHLADRLPVQDLQQLQWPSAKLLSCLRFLERR